MLRIRKLQDTTSSANREAIAQVQAILQAQFPRATAADLAKVPRQLEDPLAHGYRSILWVAETVAGKVRGFLMLLHLPDVRATIVEYLSTAPGGDSGGLGGALYETAREESRALGVAGLFFESMVDDAARIRDPQLLAQNRARLRFYERFGARPVLKTPTPIPVIPATRTCTTWCSIRWISRRGCSETPCAPWCAPCSAASTRCR